ncbi:MAG: cytidylate kinase family protein [Candidatus ainarchaeum sp.]|nr:cytidylate kinase family protein [Candidatus ainarchaeum sp.]
MIITIAGFAGSGKTTLGKALAAKLGYSLVSPTFKDLAKKEGIPLMEFQKKAEKDSSIDLKFDQVLKEQASKGNCVVTTWLGPWMLNADWRIWLFAPLEIRAKRVAERDGISIEQAVLQIKKREEQNRSRYLKLYGIDIFDTSGFDVSFNSGRFTPEQMADLIVKITSSKKR